MATGPYFVVSPNAVLSLIGLMHGPDKTAPTPAEDWRQATVDVIIPALNEEETIPLCLASIARQTLRPRRVVLIDDGSRDHTLEWAREFCDANGIELMAIHRKEPIGKTPTIKRQARELDSDVEFILDGDTILESDNYIERAVEELYKAKGIASACGVVLPLRGKDRAQLLATPAIQRFRERVPEAKLRNGHGFWHRLNQGVTNLYRSVLYLFLQRFVYRGEMAFFGTITNPVGCAVAYRRKYVKDLFDHYEPILGDDLTNSEDIFIGFAMLNEGYRNIQLMDVYARSQEPESHRLPRQIYLWSSSFLQSCYYFDGLLRSPFKGIKRYLHNRRAKKTHEEKRKIQEPYRQPFGRAYTKTYGRPVGWVLLMGAIEKVGFPTALLIMLGLQLWEPLLVTLIAESVLSLTILTVIAEGRRWEYLAKGILVTPIRYTSLFYDLITMGRFANDLWFRRHRGWRK
jgi:glycosyltransferase involved in cell wall biosynthesis